MLAGLRGAIMIGGIASAIKLMKSFYEKQQAAMAMEKEKIQAELQVLRAQLHPHFLFNTLNNIYSLTQQIPNPASAMILRLSGMLRYILYSGSKELVALDGELKMIDDYIKLEALRYDESLDLSIELPANTNALIAPLLLLPFVENAFKHGASRMIERPWISLRAEVTDNKLTMVMVNGFDPEAPQEQGGIGIENVKKRLQLLYPGKHTLQLRGEEELFYVNLMIDLGNEYREP
ncbi:MAG: two-component system sensor protein [Chitinophagaceae bacterium]|nr:MAG: two-component system sensor protein [Chitinophagaceae bacterium]